MKKFADYLIKKVTLGLLLVATGLSAQVSSFKHFGLDKSIFPSRIECIAQNSDGELVIGTLAGLVVYDGQTFHQISEREGLAENAVSSLASRHNQVWVGHWAGSLSILHITTGAIMVYDLRQDLNFSSIVSVLPKDSVTALLVSREGFLFEFKSGQVEQIRLPLSMNGGSETILDVHKHGEFIYATTNEALYRTSGKGGEWERFARLDSKVVTNTLRLADKTWLVGTKEGAFELDVTTGIRRSSSLEDATKGFNISAIIQDSEEYVWIATAENGIVRYHPITGEVNAIKRDNGLSYSQIRSIFLDREGTVWIGTSAGLDQYLGRSFLLHDKRSGYPDNLIWDFVIDGDKYVLATASGLYQGVPYSSEGWLKIDLQGSEPRRIFMDPHQNGWWIIDAEGGLWRTHGAKPYALSGISSRVRCIENVNGEIWAGTDDGIYVLEENEIAAHITTESGLGGSRINGIYYSKAKNECWITALGGQATRFQDGKFKKYGRDEGLATGFIQDAAFDKEGNPWFASYDAGVFHLVSDSFHNVSSQVELTSNTTFAIDIDAEGTVWVGHNWGMDAYRIPFGDVVHFGVDEGFMGIEVNPGALKIDSKGGIWMGTLMGLLNFIPANHRINITEPKLRILSATLDGVPVGADLPQFGLMGSGGNFRVVYKGVSLVNTAANLYKYRLIGLDEEWKTRSSSEAIEFQSLSPGSYTLELAMCNNSGKCTSDVERIEFKVHPPFYRAWWFYLVMFIITIILIFMLDSLRLSNLIADKNSLEESLAKLSDDFTQLNNEAKALRIHKDNGEASALSISGESIPELSWLGRWEVNRISVNNISSDQFFTINTGHIVLTGFIDLNTSGVQALLALEAIKRRVIQLLMVSGSNKPADVLESFANAVKQVFEGMPKHKPSPWMVWVHVNGSTFFRNHGIRHYRIKNNEAARIKDDVLKSGSTVEYSMDKGERWFFVSDGVSELLHDQGIKTFASQLDTLICDSPNMSTKGMFELLRTEISSWQGMMEQQDDMTILCLHAD